jgi:hypothetical protein
VCITSFFSTISFLSFCLQTDIFHHIFVVTVSVTLFLESVSHTFLAKFFAQFWCLWPRIRLLAKILLSAHFESKVTLFISLSMHLLFVVDQIFLEFSLLFDFEVCFKVHVLFIWSTVLCFELILKFCAVFIL